MFDIVKEIKKTTKMLSTLLMFISAWYVVAGQLAIVVGQWK